MQMLLIFFTWAQSIDYPVLAFALLLVLWSWSVFFRCASAVEEPAKESTAQMAAKHNNVPAYPLEVKTLWCRRCEPARLRADPVLRCCIELWAGAQVPSSLRCQESHRFEVKSRCVPRASPAGPAQGRGTLVTGPTAWILTSFGTA